MFIKDNTATIIINGEVTAEMGEELSFFLYGLEFMDEINNIDVHICSGGGSVIAGYAIYSALLNLRTEGKIITTINDGFAASIAGIIYLVGNIREARDYALFMLHNPSGGDDKTLNKIKSSLKQILGKDFTGDLDEMMNAETWLDYSEMEAMNLVGSKIETGLQPLVNVTNVNSMYEICNNILKNDNNMKDLTNEMPLEEDKPMDEVVTETPEEEKVEEDALASLIARVEALEKMVADLMVEEETEPVEAPMNEDATKEEVMKNCGIKEEDYNLWKSLDVETIKNLTASVKTIKVVEAPVIKNVNSFEKPIITQVIFNKMNQEEKLELLKNDFTTYMKLFKNSK